jgi:hypothetical protein
VKTYLRSANYTEQQRKADLDYHPDRLKLLLFILTFDQLNTIIGTNKPYAQRRCRIMSVILSSAQVLPAPLRMSLISEKPVGSQPMGFSYFVVVVAIIHQKLSTVKWIIRISAKFVEQIVMRG